MKPEEERIDLSPLDPENDPLRLERVVEGVMERLGPGLVPGDPEPVGRQIEGVLLRNSRPVIAACVVAAAAAAGLLLLDPSDSALSGELRSPTDLVELPPEWGAWMSADESPQLEELLITFAGAGR